MKRNIKIIVLSVLACICMSSCTVGKFKQIKITSAKLESVSFAGLKGLDAIVDIGVHNPAPSFNLMNIRANIKKDTASLIDFVAENVAVEGKSDRVYRVPVRGVVAPGISVLSLAKMASNFNPDEFTVSVRGRAVVGGIGKDLVYDNIPLTKLLKMKDEE